MAMARAEKRDRVDSGVDSLDSKRGRVDSGVYESEKIREEFLEILEEEEFDVEPEIQGLESVMRSLEEEINLPVKEIDDGVVLNELDQVELGFLLEASDDELGLPPPTEIDSQTANLTGGSADEIGENNGGDLLTIDGLFEYGGCTDASDVPEVQWWPESMPAL